VVDAIEHHDAEQVRPYRLGHAIQRHPATAQHDGLAAVVAGWRAAETHGDGAGAEDGLGGGGHGKKIATEKEASRDTAMRSQMRARKDARADGRNAKLLKMPTLFPKLLET